MAESENLETAFNQPQTIDQREPDKDNMIIRRYDPMAELRRKIAYYDFD